MGAGRLPRVYGLAQRCSNRGRRRSATLGAALLCMSMLLRCSLLRRRGFSRRRRGCVLRMAVRSHAATHAVQVHVLPHDRDAASRQLQAVAPRLARARVLGLDCEWQPETQLAPRSRVSVIQLSSDADCVILQPLQLLGSSTGLHAAVQHPSPAPVTSQGTAAAPHAMDVPPPLPQLSPAVTDPGASKCEGLPWELVCLLEDPAVVKGGVGIAEDVKRLRRDFGVHVRGVLDVRVAAQVRAPHLLAGGGSLRGMSACVLGVSADKRLQCSSWGRPCLTRRQLEYAAQDAWLSQQLGVALALDMCAKQQQQQQQEQWQQQEQQQERQEQQQQPEEQQQQQQQKRRQEDQQPEQVPQGARQRERGQLRHQQHQARAVEQSDTAAAPRADVLFSVLLPLLDKLGKPSDGASRSGSGAALPSPDTPPSRLTPMGQRRRAAKPPNMPTRKTELYENCRLLAPDGATLCTCGRKKIQWYIERGLAELVCSEPPCARLIFEPRGRGNADDEYYLADKLNRCCVCGFAGDYLRHSVVPHCYRSLFPQCMKSHMSHDVLLLCQACQQVCGRADQARMAQLGERYGAPLEAASKKFELDYAAGGAKSAARALTGPRAGSLPPDRRAALEATVLSHFAADVLSAELLARACALQDKAPAPGWRSHAHVVVSALLAEPGGRGIEDFVRGWRAHFLEAMRPRFLPPHWSIDSRVANSAAPQAEGRQESQVVGPQKSQAEGHQGSQADRQQDLQAEGQQGPLAEGQQESQAEGQQESQAKGQQESKAEGQQDSQAEGKQASQAEGQQERQEAGRQKIREACQRETDNTQPRPGRGQDSPAAGW